MDFPPTRLLLDIAPKEETPARTPWWLTLLRLTLAALVILAAAGPMWNPPVSTATAQAPLVVLIDDGWSSASSFDARLRTATDLVARAQADGRGVALVPLSEPTRDLSFETPDAAAARLRTLRPKPHAVERADTLPAIGRLLAGTPEAEIVWLSDSVDLGRGGEFVSGLAKLVEGRALTVVAGGVRPALALAAADNAAGGLAVKVLRADADGTSAGTVRALDLRGLPLGEATFSFAGGARETEAKFELPVEIRNDIARLEIVGEASAGAVQLLDKRWRRRTVGVVTGSTAETAQPLLASTFYLSRALGPFADARIAERGSPAEAVTQFIDQRLPMMVLADVGNVAGEAREKLSRWVEDGGVLVRFAGPRLAAADDDLVPVRLRRGGRVLGGSLSWEQPQRLASFSHEGPFVGLPVPEDVTITRQVLAEPDSSLVDHTWAALADGTPLVTAAKRGKGMVVLFHVTADTRWSDLPLSGAFVEMLRRIVGLSGAAVDPDSTAQAAGGETVAPTRLLDGYGVFGPPPPTARPVAAGYTGRATADNPPGFYGPPEGLVAVNTLIAADRPKALDFAPLGGRVEPYRATEPQDLRGPVFLGAIALAFLDAVVVFWLAGGLARLTGWRRAPAALLLGVGLALAATPSPLRADPAADAFAAKATSGTRLAFVTTGNAEVDAISKSGLQSLTVFLGQRTALEAGEPLALDISRDELAFFPVIYWPIVPDAPKPSAQALARVDAYMKQGGTILFDTRDAVEAAPGSEMRSPGMVALRGILSSLDIPELEPIPKEHVLTKTFFLLRDFPGRFTAGRLWVEAMPASDPDGAEERRPARAGDGVSSILITSNDLAGAWATRPDGQALLPLVPGEPRQREHAFRAGVNIVMYALTGNYKADQVHVPALLERLGQ
ncbi:LytTR family transcriptional regulator [Rhodoplanes roseus]|uniref:LytTR family transcriptional regulator n=1 Tax=Rhodoplanes roseus TaxID=29409 RepID=A0A327KMF5_9BRAD|nr:LytTR family transcriptional regulator [Rhodoplanes roseus]